MQIYPVLASKASFGKKPGLIGRHPVKLPIGGGRDLSRHRLGIHRPNKSQNPMRPISVRALPVLS